MRKKDMIVTLQSMTVLVDTREQETDRLHARLKDLRYERACLDYGDYTYNAMVNGEWIHDVSAPRIFPAAAIERKMDLDELAMCFTHSRERFMSEIDRADQRGARLWLLIENAKWTDILEHRYQSKISVNSMMGSIQALQTRHGVQVILCDEWDTGQMIQRILRWELKERLEGGEYG